MYFLKGNGAAEGTRTPDPNITNVVLYQLSYCGIRADLSAQRDPRKHDHAQGSLVSDQAHGRPQPGQIGGLVCAAPNIRFRRGAKGGLTLFPRRPGIVLGRFDIGAHRH